MADEYYNNKIVTTDGDVLMDLTQDTATPETVLEGETFHQKSGAPATGTYRPSDEIEARLRATVGHSSKNLLEITARTTTRYEVTFTPDRINGTILATGQCNPPIINQAQYDYAGGIKPIPDSFRHELILEDDGLIVGTQSAIAFYNDSEVYVSGVVCDGNTKSKTVTVPSNATKYKVFVRKTASAGDVDVTFKPMLREASISDGSFEPYQEPTDSLIETKVKTYLNSTVGHSSKNLLEVPNGFVSFNGVTYTANKTAGTITASGTATADAQLDFQGSSPKSVSTLKNGLTYSCEGTNVNLVCAISYYNSSGRYISEQRATTSGTIITIPSDAVSYKFWVRKRPAAGSETFIFKPMLRDGSISDDSFEPYVTPTDEAKQDKPVVLYDAGESSVGAMTVTGLSNLTQYQELHITLFAPVNGDDPRGGLTHTIVYSSIFPEKSYNHVTCDCWVIVIEDDSMNRRRASLDLLVTDTAVKINGEYDENGEFIHIPSNHYIYIKRIVGIP